MSLRIRLLALAALLAAAAVPSASAQTSAAKPIRLLVGFPAGQATDLVARVLAERLSADLGQPVVVENRPGQGGSLALAQLARATPDGTTMSLSALASLVTNPHLYKNVGYHTLEDLTPIGLVADLPLLLIVNPSVPAKTLPELVAYAKANPEKLTHSSSGNGTLSHLAMEHLKKAAGINILHVPYQGSVRAIADLVGGQVDVALDTIAVTYPHVEAGKARLLAVGTTSRLPNFPDVPTIAEGGYPGFNGSAWLMLLYPANVAKPVVSETNAALVKAVRSREVADKLATLGAIPRTSTAEEAAAHLASEWTRWGEIVRSTGAKLD